MEQKLDRADQFRERLCATLAGEYYDERRTTLIRFWFHIASETHEAISVLMRQNLNGPAYALLRSVYELFVRSAWVATCATEEQADAILNCDDFRYPTMKAMAERIDENLQGNAFIDGVRKNLWGPMNSFTHGGLLQLSRRVRGGRMEPNYEDTERIEVIEHVTMTLLLHGLFLSSTPNSPIGGEAIIVLILEWNSHNPGEA